MKTTKGQAKEICDSFRGILHWLNGGTAEENERSAARCFEQLTVYANQAAEAVKNPGKLLLADDWRFNALSELPDRAKAFGERYGLVAE